ncbi:MAG: hypothetical protein AAGG38_07220 [Planctomycetota bacterium]
MPRPMTRNKTIKTYRYTLEATYEGGQWWPRWRCQDTGETGSPSIPRKTSDEAFRDAENAAGQHYHKCHPATNP